MSAILRLDQVSFHALQNRGERGLPLLHDLSFAVNPGDRVAIIGPSGAGKTSLLRLLNRLSEPSQGTITLHDQDIRQIPVIQLRRQVALVPQESRLLGMTVQAALAYPLELQALDRTTIQARVSATIEQFRIPSDWLDRNELQLSVGQRQWVAIARAILTQPQILLLDEPTAALDAGRADALVQILHSLTATGQLTVLMVNHQLDIAQQFCDRVLYLQNGILQENRPAQDLDWVALRQRLLAAEAQAAAEWS